MTRKLSDYVKEIPEHFEVLRESLYVKSKDPEKKCGVCSLGGIALLASPDRFEVVSGILRDVKTGEVPRNSDILEGAGLPYSKQVGDFEYTTTDKYGKRVEVHEAHLSTFIFMVNDQAKDSIKSVVRALRKYGF